MTPNEYQTEALRSAPQDHSKVKDRLLEITLQLTHAQLGISSESGELADAIKKSLIYGQTLDTTNIVEECGDILWYVALALNAVNCSMEVAMYENIEKLKRRYPNKFTEADALERKDKRRYCFCDRELLEGQVICPACGKENHP